MVKQTLNKFSEQWKRYFLVYDNSLFLHAIPQCACEIRKKYLWKNSGGLYKLDDNRDAEGIV